jgi:hypothetical protein
MLAGFNAAVYETRLQPDRLHQGILDRRSKLINGM